jgi:thioredoxin 1
MKKHIPITLVFLMFFMIGAKPDMSKPDKGVSFTQTSLANAIQLAKAQKKLIFIDVYAPWCMPCIMLKLKTFSNKGVGDFYNKNFISLALNGEKDEGLKLFQAYGLTVFPTLIILNCDGSPLLATEGYLDAKTLIEFGEAGIEKSKL